MERQKKKKGERKVIQNKRRGRRRGRNERRKPRKWKKKEEKQVARVGQGGKRNEKQFLTRSNIRLFAFTINGNFQVYILQINIKSN